MKHLDLDNFPLPAIVDDEDYEQLQIYKWFVDGQGYVRRRGTTKPEMLHQCIIGPTYSNFIVVDHEDQDKLNNTRKNLRRVSKSINCANGRRRLHPAYAITQLVDSYSVIITRNYKKNYIGKFQTFAEAVVARDTFLTQEKLKHEQLS